MRNRSPLRASADQDLRARPQAAPEQLASPRASTKRAGEPEYAGREAALLDRARTLAELDRTSEARQAYARILSEFPSAAAEVERRLRNLPDEQEEALQALGYGGGDSEN